MYLDYQAVGLLQPDSYLHSHHNSLHDALVMFQLSIDCRARPVNLVMPV